MNVQKILLFPLLFCVAACANFSDGDDEKKLIAQVFDKKLYDSDLVGMLPVGLSAEDSLMLAQAYVERWARDALILHKAEKNIPDNLDIEQLVENYRSSLIRHHYEEAMVEEMLETAIPTEELQAFYDENKEQYELDKTIIKAYFIKMDQAVEQPATFRDWWESCITDSINCDALREFCATQAEQHILMDTAWYSLDKLANWFPEGTLTEKNIRTKREFIQSDDDHEYYFKSFEIVNQKDIAPLSYIEEQAKNFILKYRKQKLLESTKQELYEDELLKGNIQIYY